MPNKSYVTMEQQVCVVCGHPFDTGSLLLDRRMRDKFEQHTLTGWGLCEEHQKLKDEGYVAFVGVDEEKSLEAGNTARITPENAYRTGAMAHLRKSVYDQIIDVPCPEGMVVFCPTETIELLQDLSQGANDDT